MGLNYIEQAIAAKKWDDALDDALVEWRACKAPAWANLIDAISAKISRAGIPAPTVRWGFIADEWGARARSRFAIDIPVLLDAFGRDLVLPQPRVSFDTTQAAVRVRAALSKENVSFTFPVEAPFMILAHRLDALAAFGPDPRTARGLLRFIENTPIAVEGALAVATYAPTYDFIAQVGDTRILPALELMPPTPSRDRAIATLQAIVVPSVANEAAVMELAKSLGFVATGHAVDITELLAMVASDLADDTPRAILADMWLEAGDARGEFVALQLRAAKGEASEAELDRMNTLEVQGQREWLGDLALFVRNARFHRGFFDEITLDSDAVAPVGRWWWAAREQRLATVRMLRPGLATHAVVALFVKGLPNLEELEVASVPGYRAIVEGPRPPRLTRIELNLPWTPAPPGTIRPPRRPLPTSEVRALLELGFERVTVPYAEPRTIAEHAALLGFATERGSVVLRAMDARFTATRGDAGLVLDIESRDSFTVNAALDACPDATVTLRRPRGASLYGYNGEAMRLTQRVKALAHRATLDASWRKMLKL